MWKYTQTDEMFVKRNDSELFHSDIYLGKDFSDGFRHWKYIKKEKRNGKWVYIYNDPEKANNDYIRKYINDVVNAKHDAYEKEEAFNKLARKSSKLNPELKSKYDMMSEELHKNTENAQSKAQKEFDEYARKFEKENGKLTDRDWSKDSNKLVKSTAKFLVKTLNSASNAIDKGKKFLKKLFKF